MIIRREAGQKRRPLARMREDIGKVFPFPHPNSLIGQENFPPLADGAQKLYPSGTPTMWK